MNALCPRCTGLIHPGEDTARHNGQYFHAGCLEDLLRADAEDAEARDAAET